tara:strand:- start:286 stop:459 length:174 start_codon:yes stop_codon:yes gene_type:complete
MKTYHIYLEDNKCLFKNLNEEEFNIIWNKLYTSYWKDEITYEEITEVPTDKEFEHSY